MCRCVLMYRINITCCYEKTPGLFAPLGLIKGLLFGSQFSDQFITDLGELLDLLIL